MLEDKIKIVVPEFVMSKEESENLSINKTSQIKYY